MDDLSSRGEHNLNQVFAKIPKRILEPITDPDTVDLSGAENHLIREEVLTIVKEAISQHLHQEHLDWPRGFWGNEELLDLLAKLFNNHFQPDSRVTPNEIVVTAGAAASLDAILYNTCEAGDGVLVPTPYWPGYDTFFSCHSGIVPISVNVPDLADSLYLPLINALEEAYAQSPCRIRGLLLCNPHNPLGRCYSREILEDCARFCQRHSLHLISDEVYAMSNFNTTDLSDSRPFVSMLSLSSSSSDFDNQRIHVIWSTSKVLSATGARLGCLVTRNRRLRNTAALLTSSKVSALATVFATTLLSSTKLPGLLKLITTGLTDAYHQMTTFFIKNNMEYFPCNSTIFICARLAPLAVTAEQELTAVSAYASAGVLVIPGLSYRLNENYRGWMRVTFAVDKKTLQRGLERIGTVYQRISVGTENS